MKVSIIGPGSFGTAIAQLISRNVDEVMLFGRNNDLINSINQEHVNPGYHPLIELNRNIKAYNISTQNSLINETDLVIMSIPSGILRDIIHDLRTFLSDKIIISTIKGIDYPSLNFITQIIKNEAQNDNVFSISGPTFADELIRNLLSGMTLGVDKIEHKKTIVNVFKSPNLLLDFSEDVEGVELCGVLKNVYAIAMGIFDSFFYGSNEHYVFLNSCFNEMKLILDELNHDKNLINKFCGFGDLNLTACVDKSRNRTLGLMIGKGISLNLNESSITLEGLKSARAVEQFSKANKIEAPIVNFVSMAFNNHNIGTDLSLLLKELNKIY